MPYRKRMSKCCQTYRDEKKFDKVCRENKKFLRIYLMEIMDDPYHAPKPPRLRVLTRDIENFFQYLYEFKDNMIVTDITAGEMQEYFEWYVTTKNGEAVGAETHRMYQIKSTIRRFFAYLERRKFIDVSPFQFIEVEYPEIKPSNKPKRKRGRPRKQSTDSGKLE